MCANERKPALAMEGISQPAGLQKQLVYQRCKKQDLTLIPRNDIASDGAVLLAAFAVWALRSPWPDLAVGAAISLLFLGTTVQVARDARRALREAGR